MSNIKTISSYLDKADWRVKENANVQFSLGGLILHTSGAATADYWLYEVYDKKIRDAHTTGEMHIHDLSMLSTYCCGWSLRQLIMEGLGGVAGKTASAPAAHLSTLVQQMVNFLGVLQNEAAGAQAFSSMDTYLAPFVRHDGLTFKQVKQIIQTLVFGLNISSRWGSQPPFTNVTFDWTVPSDLKDQPAIVAGQPLETTYGDYQVEMDMINKAFLEIMANGDADGRMFAYPIPTYNITENFDWDSENATLLFRTTGKYGIPYFQNFLNSDLNPADVRSMCCRLSLDKKELRRRGGGLFGADEFTGSMGVVTINMPRIGYTATNEDEFMSKLYETMDTARDSLEIKRRFITELTERGLYPYTSRYLKHWDNHFSTIGLIGMNECCVNHLGCDISTKEGREFSLRILHKMKERIISYQESTGHLYNLEATPGESTSYRLAKIDRNRYKHIKQAGGDCTGETYYTNSTQLPVGLTSDVFEALDLQEELQRVYTGGTVFHAFLPETITDPVICKNLVRKILSNYRIPYLTMSPTYSVCVNHGQMSGEQDPCPQCGKPTEVYSRIVGYYRNVKNWNAGKAEEYHGRKEFTNNSTEAEATDNSSSEKVD